MDTTDFPWKLKREGATLRSSCRLPHVIHTAKAYPIPAPNGSTVVVYGHTSGLRVLWVGGRAFKPQPPPPPPPPKKPQEKPKDEDVVMILDSDDEQEATPSAGPPPPRPVAPPGFEEREEEHDPSHPAPAVLQCLDLLPGLDVLQVAFPPLSSDALSLVASPPMAARHLILAAACSDYQVRLVTLPLLPPSPEEKRYIEDYAQPISAHRPAGPFGEQVLALLGQPGLVGVPAAVAVTITPKDTRLKTGDAKADGRADGDGDDSNTDAEQLPLDVWRGQGAAAAHAAQLQKYDDWDIVVATLYGSGSPCLAIHRISISPAAPDSGLDFGLPTDPAPFTSIETLASPALQLAFNPALSPARHHSYLLITDTVGCVQLYDYRWNASHAATSASAAAAAAASDDSSSSNPQSGGPWLLSLYPSFAISSSSSTAAAASAAASAAAAFGTAPRERRKDVVDATWAMGGRAVVALLADGAWGVWDIYGTGGPPGPRRRTGGLLREMGRRNALRGGALTPFSVSGRIDDGGAGGASNYPSRSARRKADEQQQQQQQQQQPPNLVPRTPRTRKVQQQMLFGPPPPPPPAAAAAFASASALATAHHGRRRGGVVVQPWCDASAAAVTSHEPRRETLVFWLDDQLAVLPDLSAYWEDQIAKTAAGSGGAGAGGGAGGGNLLDADPCRGLIRLDGLAGPGDTVSSVDVSPRRLLPKSKTIATTAAGVAAAATAERTRFRDASADAVLLPDILVATGRHLVVVSGGADAKPNAGRTALEDDYGECDYDGYDGYAEQVTAAGAAAAGDGVLSGLPQLVMGSRELSLDEIDLAVTRMERRPAARRALLGDANRRRVAFAAGI